MLFFFVRKNIFLSHSNTVLFTISRFVQFMNECHLVERREDQKEDGGKEWTNLDWNRINDIVRELFENQQTTSTC